MPLQAVDQDSLNYSIIYSILKGLRVQIYNNIHIKRRRKLHVTLILSAFTFCVGFYGKAHNYYLLLKAYFQSVSSVPQRMSLEAKIRLISKKKSLLPHQFLSSYMSRIRIVIQYITRKRFTCLRFLGLDPARFDSYTM